MGIKIPYYSDNSRINNSAIGWFINYGPTYFRLRLDGKTTEEESNAMVAGTMIHKWTLQHDDFWNDYRMFESDDRRLSPNAKQFCENYTSSIEIEEDKALIGAYRNAYSVADLSDEKVLEKALKLAEECKNTIADTKLNDSRHKINDYMLNKCRLIEQNIRSHKLANELLYTENSDEISTFNEFHINWNFPKQYYDQEIQCKSLIDRWMIDHKNKVVTLVDLKTTLDVHNFQNSVVKYDYYRQLSFYWFAILWYMKNELGIDALNENYTFRTFIVAAQTNGEYTVRTFAMDDKIIDNKTTVIGDTIEQIAWHMKNNLWDHTKEYFDGDGAEQLKSAA